jgi:hypothetical protein
MVRGRGPVSPKRREGRGAKAEGEQLTFWQALGLLALCRILFGGSGWHRPMRSKVRRRVADRVADRMGDRWDVMTPEERERFRQRIRERCGFDPSTSESKGQ